MKPDNPLVGIVLNNLVILCEKMGKKKEAAGILERADAVLRRLAERK
ncbi:MAG TPA: hypothetical protein QF533_05850 [Nitrospinota bacterium]|jgi:hypothetical protein|nr:hypothetical protein [Nitrospinota bacterium]MDP7503260.1 hypothetical protein [Nitrospinota bacterium]MDP7663201.1 hypothetical protein [Nitrospinota bacterium]HJP13860.1 hypothetical protein [Nitrospinota bacterium]